MMKSYNDFTDEEDSDYDMSDVNKYYEERDSVNTIDHVEDNIYIGDYRGASDLEKLKELNIKKIVSIGLPRERIFYKRFENIEYLDLNINKLLFVSVVNFAKNLKKLSVGNKLETLIIDFYRYILKIY